MKKYSVICLLIMSFLSVNSQIIKDFGKVYKVESPDLLLDTNTEYKVIFDIYTDNTNGEKVNPLLNTVARFINMHKAQGVLLKNMKIVVILHGRATKSALTDDSYLEMYKINNPNSKLIEVLKTQTLNFLFVDNLIRQVSMMIKINLKTLKWHFQH